MTLNRLRHPWISPVSAVALALFAGLGWIAQSAASTKPPVTPVTFNKDIAPILFKSCTECHRPGEAAPFSLMSYKDARPWAKSIREQVVSRQMPPWHADPHVGAWANDRRLSQTEIEKIAAWADSGAPEGKAKDLPPAPQFVEGWRIGKPDLVLTMPNEFTLDASGPDEYQNFEIPLNFTEDRYVLKAEARPGNRKIVHHIIAYIVPPPPKSDRPKPSPEELAKLRAEAEKEAIFYQEGFLQRVKTDAPIYDDGCVTKSGGIGFKRDGSGQEAVLTALAGFAPGSSGDLFETGIGIKVPAGSKIRLEVHYSKVAGAVEKDRSSVGVIFAKELPKQLAVTRGIGNTYFQIPPGAAHHRVTGCWTAQEDIHLHSLTPHMHYRGAAMEYKVFYPDGRTEVLLNVPNYSFAWQTTYVPQRPLAIPKGTKFLVTGDFDNSAKNRFNPDPTKAVRFGQPTYDEMMIGFINYTVDGQPVKPVTTAVSSIGH
ncbi:MAG: cytochrome c [Acidobacteria bacterium]|nr:cytochrome c [Acidobacteriota bacterium]MBI3424277.1 cytochrome c [Acidobacteriota bacterium]